MHPVFYDMRVRAEGRKLRFTMHRQGAPGIELIHKLSKLFTACRDGDVCLTLHDAEGEFIAGQTHDIVWDGIILVNLMDDANFTHTFHIPGPWRTLVKAHAPHPRMVQVDFTFRRHPSVWEKLGKILWDKLVRPTSELPLTSVGGRTLQEAYEKGHVPNTGGE